MTITIITDGAADLPLSFIEKHSIKIVPLNISFGDQNFKTGIDIDNETFYRMMKESTELPKSSSPAPYDFLQVYKEVPVDKAIIVFTISAGLSSTYDSAVMGMNMLLDEQPNRKIAVINTKNASSGQILLIDEAVKLRDCGTSFEEVVSNSEASVEATNTLVLLETLENVIKGGRLSRTKAAIANALNIKLILSKSSEGTIEVREKVRGEKKVLRRLIELIGESGRNFEQSVLTMTHCNCEVNAVSILDDIKAKYNFKDTILSEMGPLIATYAGEGGIVISFKS